jgi:hypothetical protein
MIRLMLLVALGCLTFSGAAEAHKLEVSYQLLPRLRVRVYGRYEGGAPASGARVRIVQTDGLTLCEGRLDKYGIFIFDITDAKDINIVVSVAGHRAEETIAAATLQRHILAYCSACVAPQPLHTAALLELEASAGNESTRAALASDVPSNVPWTGLLIGVGVLSVTAIVFKQLSKRKTA